MSKSLCLIIVSLDKSRLLFAKRKIRKKIMAKQTEFCTKLIPAKVVEYFLFYIWNLIKLYFIGALALLYQILETNQTVNEFPFQSEKTAIVTGGASGIGFHISKQLASLGARVVIASRSRKDAEGAIAKIKKDKPDAKVEFLPLDLSSFRSVQQFAADFLAKDWPLHILVNNAGVMLIPYQQTEDGHEYHLQVNFLSHALLTNLLYNKMKSSATSVLQARIVNVSSVVHKVASFDLDTFDDRCENGWSYSPHNAYAVSKLAILFYTYALSRQLKHKHGNITINAVHPGVVNTNLYQHVHWSVRWAMTILRHLFFMSPAKAAEGILHVAVSPDVEKKNGCYFSLFQQDESSEMSKVWTIQDAVYFRTVNIISKKLD